MASDDVMPGLEELPEEVLSRIFGLLSSEQLAEVELICRRCRAVVVRHELWRQRSLAACPALAAATASVDASAVPCHRPGGSEGAASAAMQLEGSAAGGPLPPPQQAVPAAAARRSALFKRLHRRLAEPAAQESLVMQALAASSTDHPQEGIANVLRPVVRSRELTCYWSSRGSQDPDSDEALTFQLAHPLCLVSEVAVRPFRAFFQWGFPIYAARAVRIRLGGLPCFDVAGAPLPLPPLRAAAERDLLSADARRAGGEGSPAGPAPLAPAAGGEAQWVWESPAFELPRHDELVRFRIDPPALCVGGYLRVDLLGKRQPQAIDGLFYSCVGYLRASGTPLYNFQLRPAAAAPPEGRQPAAAAGAAGAAGAAAAAEAQQQAQQAAAVLGGGAQQAQAPPFPACQLAYLENDPLLEAGGLAAVCEAGRLAAARAAGLPAAADDGSESEAGTEDLDPDFQGDLDALGAAAWMAGPAGAPPQPVAWPHGPLMPLPLLPLPPQLQPPPQQLPQQQGQGEDGGSDSDHTVDVGDEGDWFPGGDAGAY